MDKVPSMLSIMYDVLTDAKLDSQQRVVEMLKESKVIFDIYNIYIWYIYMVHLNGLLVLKLRLLFLHFNGFIFYSSVL